jgi:hypothetical protein
MAVATQVYDVGTFFRTRQILEMLCPKDAAEILLSHDGDSILEGLTTNFFVVRPTVCVFELLTLYFSMKTTEMTA